ncbi:MAG: hypothetical protein LJF06_05120 [Gemmatimonadetes bacterium]|nr:hypothetical protein [Gemmatimonadota bacterium]
MLSSVSQKARSGLVMLVVACAFLSLPQAVRGQGRARLLELAKQAYQNGLTGTPASVQSWERTFKPTPEWGYTPPGAPPYMARLSAMLYKQTGDEAYAREAIKWLVAEPTYLKYFPESMRHFRPDYVDGVPPLTNFFEAPYYIGAYLLVKDSPSMTAADRRTIENSISESLNYIFKYPEWGPMNRAMLRAYALELGVEAMPESPDAPRWKKMSRVLASDSWEHWDEEDAKMYHSVWFLTVLRYADAVGDSSLYQHPTVQYYFDYFTHLLDPTGNVPQFGDARYHSNWSWYVAILERGATVYHRADYRWAAQRILNANLPANGRIGTGDGMNLLDAYLWSEDGPASPPPARSEDVMEDLVGKKIVFRDGYDANANYLFLNYRDEGTYDRMPRDFLRHTIPAEEEKQVHGHSDENAINLLMSKGSVLLDDGGYRPELPSGPNGEDRADYFHNRLVWRMGKVGRDQSIWDFIRNAGSYETVETEKIDFLRGDGFDMSRTRVTDRHHGVQQDRVITWLKKENVWVVFDIVKFLQTGYYTMADLWDATTILDHGDDYYVTAIDTIAGHPQKMGTALRIDMPKIGPRREGTFPLMRNGDKNIAVYEALGSHYLAGQVETFVTVLTPVPRADISRSPVKSVRVVQTPQERRGIGVVLTVDGSEILVAAKTDLDYGILTANVRPRYTWASGRVDYGPFATDADFFLARTTGDTVSWAATNMVGVRYHDQELFAAPSSTYTLQPDDLSSTGKGPPKWRYWSGTAEVKK